MVYVSDPAARAVRAYALSGDDGSLTPMAVTEMPGSPFTAPMGLSRFCALVWGGNASKRFLYAVNPSDPGGGITAYSIELDGSLAPVPGSPFPLPAGTGPLSLGCPEPPYIAKFLYVGMQTAGAVAGFAIAEDGTLSALASSPYAAGRGTASMVRAADFVYAQNSTDGTISGYSADPASGVLTALAGSPFASAAATGDLATGAAGGNAVLYLADATSSRIFTFQFDGTTGALTPAAGSPLQLTESPAELFYVQFTEKAPFLAGEQNGRRP